MNFPTAQEVFSKASPNTLGGQYNAEIGWEATKWNGGNQLEWCVYMPHGNSLILAGKIPGAWLVQIKDAGHAVMAQYPDKINKILETFLSTTRKYS